MDTFIIFGQLFIHTGRMNLKLNREKFYHNQTAVIKSRSVDLLGRISHNPWTTDKSCKPMKCNESRGHTRLGLQTEEVKKRKHHQIFSMSTSQENTLIDSSV